MENFKKFLIILFVAVYVLSPADLVPGSFIDDIIVVLFSIWSQRNKVIDEQ